MTDLQGPILVFVAVLAAAVLLVVSIGAVRRASLKRMANRLNTEVASRGWTVSSSYADGVRSLQWRGAAQDVTWAAESNDGLTGSDEDRRRVRDTRWQTTGFPAGAAVIALIGASSDRSFPTSWPAPGSPMADMVASAVAAAVRQRIGQQFGSDAAAAAQRRQLQRVEEAERRLPGYVVLADDAAAAVRVVDRGIASALASDAAAPSQSSLSAKPFLVVICPEGVGLTRAGAVQTLPEFEAVLNTGLAVARAVRLTVR